jgi:hypothetical protein
MRSLSCREYLRAVAFVRQRAASEQNPNAKQYCKRLERSYNRLVEIENWLAQQQRKTPGTAGAQGEDEPSPTTVEAGRL